MAPPNVSNSDCTPIFGGNFWYLSLLGWSALHLAVQSGHHEVVEVLLGHGASVYLKAGKNKESPLHVCARTKNGHHSAEVLIKSGCPVNDTDEVGSDDQCTKSCRRKLCKCCCEFKARAQTGDASVMQARGCHCAISAQLRLGFSRRPSHWLTLFCSTVFRTM